MSPAARRVLILQHVPWETAGRLQAVLDAHGIGTETRLLLGEAAPTVPEPDELAGLVLMGGPMGADDLAAHPALGLERDLARRAVDAGVPVLGICLGHQILALALGGTLDAGATWELGVAPIEVTADSALGRVGTTPPVLHWHGDNVSLPPGAELLARSPECPVQAFRSGPALGLQFHLEVGPDLLEQWLAAPPARAEVGSDEEVSRVRADLAAADGELRRMADAVFGEFADAVQRR